MPGKALYSQWRCITPPSFSEFDNKTCLRYQVRVTLARYSMFRCNIGRYIDVAAGYCGNNLEVEATVSSCPPGVETAQCDVRNTTFKKSFMCADAFYLVAWCREDAL